MVRGIVVPLPLEIRGTWCEVRGTRIDCRQTYLTFTELPPRQNTPFSKGTIQGILTDMVECIRELTLQGNTVKIENLAIFKCSVQSNPCSRYGVMRASIGAKSTKVNGQTVETGNAVKSMKLLAQATGEYVKAELNKDATLGWTKLAQEKIDADKEAMNEPQNP